MSLSGSEQQLCPCYKGSCEDFQKLVELKDSSLVVYCHRIRIEDVQHQSRQDEAVEHVENTSRDVFIIHNRKDTRLSTSQLTSELEKKNISCPRCRKIFEHAQELMQEVKSIERNIVIGICDHCRKKAQTIKNQFCVCDEIVRKFKLAKREHKENIKKHAKTWLSKMEHILKDAKTLNKPKQIKYRAYSDLQINRDLKSSTSRYKPEIQQMFGLETNKSDIYLNREMRETVLKEDYFKQGVTFSQPLISIKPMATSFSDTSHENENINTMIPRISLMETSEDVKALPKTSFEYRRKEDIFQDTPSTDAKDALKRRHDLSLRQMMRLEKDSGVVFNVSTKPMVHEIPKNAPWEQKELTPKYHEDSEIDDLRHRGTRDLDYSSKTLIKKGTRNSYKNLRDSYDQKKTDKYNDNKKSRKSSLKSKKLDPQVSKSKSWYKKAPKPETGVKTQFSYYFPKITAKEKKQAQPDVTSSNLIKFTQEKFRQQAEKKRQEDKRKQNFDHNQNKISRKEQEILYEHKQHSKKDLGSSGVDEDEKQIKAKRDKFIEDDFEKKVKPEPKEKSVEDQTIKTGKEKRDVKIRKEKETFEKKAAKERELLIKDIVDPHSKHGKLSKSKRDLAIEIKVSLSKLLKKNKKEISGNDKKMIEIKQVKEIKMKTKEGDEKKGKENEENGKLKQIEQLRNEKETLKKQAEKGPLSKHKDARSKTGKLTEIKQVSPDETQVSLSTIFKKISEEKKQTSANKKEVLEIKQKIKIPQEEGIKEKNQSKEKISKEASEFLKLQIEHSKLKALEKQKQLEAAKEKERKIKEQAERKMKEQAELKTKPVDLKIENVKMETLSKSEYLLKLVRIKQASSMKPSDVKPVDIKEHKCHHGISISIFCPLCYNSELEMEVISLDNKKNGSTESITDIIIGEKIFKIKQVFEKSREPEVVLNLHKKIYFDSPSDLVAQEEPAQKPTHGKTLTNKIAKEVSNVLHKF